MICTYSARCVKKSSVMRLLTSARGQSLKPKRLMFHSFKASSFLSWREKPSFSVSERINLDRSRINRVLVALFFFRGGGGHRPGDTKKQKKKTRNEGHETDQ